MAPAVPKDGNVEGLNVNSPRTLEACLHKGLLVEELLPRPAKAFGGPGTSKEVADRRYEFSRSGARTS